jgi:hypothetical protein
VRFTTELQRRGRAAAVVLDGAVVDAVGQGAKRFPVVATVNGYTWRTTVTRMGGEFLLGLTRAVREAAGVEAGDHVAVTIDLDEAPGPEEMPSALEEALHDDDLAEAAFARLSVSHRKEYERWIGEAKRAETRSRRVQHALEMIRQGKRPR